MSNKTKKLEILSIFVLVFLAIIFYFIGMQSDIETVHGLSIVLNGEEINEINGHKIDINLDGIYVIGDKNASYNVIEIKDKKVRCIDANCPDKICVSHGFLNYTIVNDIIICAPHKLVIQYK